VWTKKRCEILKESNFNVTLEVWYAVRVEVKGPNARVFVDKILVAEVTDSRIKQGRLMLQAGPGVHAQFDDIRVTAYAE
jgi:hypothetical protein